MRVTTMTGKGRAGPRAAAAVAAPIAAVLLAAATVGASDARADGAVQIAPALEALPDTEVDRRIDFLQQRLDEGRLGGQVWQYGWTGIYAVSTAASAVMAIGSDDQDGKVAGSVGAVKSGLALGDLLLNPLPARLGAEPMQAVPDGTRRGRLERLAVGERFLTTNAALAETRYDWRRHLTGVATNLIGGGIILAFGDSTDALVSTVTGIAVGEAQIWTQPWRAPKDLQDYRAAFPGAPASASTGLDWELRPTVNGVQLAFHF
jgi:hypothetical protein